MAGIKDIIETIVNAMTGAPQFYYAERFEQNVIADNMTKDSAIFLDAPIIGKDRVLPQGNTETTYDVSLFFFGKTTLDQLQPQRKALLDAQYLAKREFVIRCQNETSIKEVIGGSTTELYNVFDLNVDGIWLQLKLVIVDGGAVCLT